MMHRTILIGFALLGLLMGTGADWRQFRGNDIDGLAATSPPSTWRDGAPVAWENDLPGRGLASPIVVAGQVIVTASSGPNDDRLHVLSFDASSGMKNWERQFWATGRPAHHPKTSVAAPTPACDGERIFAFYSTNDVVCLDLDGNLLWYRGLTYDYPNASNSLGMSSSPVVVGDTLVCMVESDADSFSCGLDTKTGETLWKIDRPRKANWTSPVVLTGAQGDSHVLLQSSAGVAAVDPATGEVTWTYADGASTIPSSVVSGETVFVPSNGITALRPGKSNPEVPDILWNEGGLRPGTASPIVKGDRLFVVNGAGVLTAANAKSGERQWQLRLGGKFSGSPVIAGNQLYIVTEEGQLLVVDLGDDSGEILSTHAFGDTVLSTPAIADGALYIRGEHHLWKVGG
jgi:outer membrane protein assembly factor BamB